MARIKRFLRGITQSPFIFAGLGYATGPESGDGLFLENGSDFLLLENGDFLLLE